MLGTNPKLDHAHEQVAERRVVVFVEAQVLAVLEAAESPQDRHVLDAGQRFRCGTSPQARVVC